MSADGATAPVALKLEGLIKDFGGQRALAGVDFSLEGGEVHALLGENGAGKSTLIKVLAGVHRPESGSIEVAGRALPEDHLPADAASHGLRFVHQDLGLVDELSVAENIALEVGYSRKRGLVDLAATEARALDLLSRQGVQIRPGQLVGELGQAEKVMVALARSFDPEARVIVLDEVSASLPDPQVERLTKAVRSARDDGVGFIWVTHRLDELFGFADRVTVLRDGKRVATARVDDTSREQLVEWIVGAQVAKGSASRTSPASDIAETTAKVSVRGLRGLELVEPFDLEVASGEIVGITGLIGCGAGSVARLLGGSPGVEAGEAMLDEEPLPLGKPHRMRSLGVSYVPGDRASDGALPALSVRENFFPVRVPRTPDDTLLRVPSRERAATQRLIDTFRVRPEASSERALDTLSGGNQQKVIFGRAVRTRPELLVLNDPTSGVDVGAREELYGLLRRAAEAGTAIVLASTDIDEIVAEADRAVIMVGGAAAAELRGADLTRERIAAESYAVASDQEVAA